MSEFFRRGAALVLVAGAVIHSLRKQSHNPLLPPPVEQTVDTSRGFYWRLSVTFRYSPNVHECTRTYHSGWILHPDDHIIRADQLLAGMPSGQIVHTSYQLSMHGEIIMTSPIQEFTKFPFHISDGDTLTFKSPDVKFRAESPEGSYVES